MGGVTLERSKLDRRQKVQTQEPKLSNDGGGGGIGNKIFNGGGGDGDDGDDDDYFNFDGGDGDGDESFWRTAVGELYDEASLKAVLGEWFRTFQDLPLMIRQSVELGLFSSAQLVRFLCMDVRPGLTRKVTRVLSPQAARGVVGRLMADPAFMQKLFIEELVTGALSLMYEAQQRGDNFLKELDLVALNTISLMGATGAMVYLTAPSRSYGAVHKFPWQNALHNLPNHVFDANTPYRRYSLVSRAASLFTKAAELCAVGSLTGASQSLGGSALVKLHQLRDPAFQPSLQIPELKRASGGNAAYMGSLANCRYQVVSGIDRLLFDRMKLLPIYLAASSVLRAGSQVFAHKSRVFATGLPTTAPVRQPAAAAPKVRKVRKVKRRVKKQPQPDRQPERQQGSGQAALA